MKIVEIDKGIRISDIPDFSPVHTFECGQAFRWDWDGKGYVGIVKDKVIRVTTDNNDIIFENVSIDDYTLLWENYFDFKTDYTVIKGILSKDNIMKEAVDYGWGIRILNQDPWETLISFIISANNGIPRIKKTILKLSMLYGDPIIWDNKQFHSFPSPSKLAHAKINDLMDCGCGYRSEYIKKTAEMVFNNEIDLESLKTCTYENAYKILLRCMGVGPKVADCVLLFSLQKGEAFPVDVWIKRIMEYFYFKSETTPKKIKELAADKFGKLAGYAQQYLFYYAREQKIGR